MSEIAGKIARKHLSKETIEKYEAAFKVIDEEENGTINKSELLSLKDADGNEQFSADEVEAVLKTYGGGDDTMNCDEMLDFIFLSEVERLKKKFQENAGEDGSLSTEEYANMMRGIGMDNDKIEAGFAVLDKDNTGTVTIEEMVAFLLTPPEPAEED